MRKSVVFIIVAVVLAASLFPIAVLANLKVAPETVSVAKDATVNLVTQAAKTKPMNLEFQYSAYWTNGKGPAYKAYTSNSEASENQPVIYKARISGDILYLWGEYVDRNSGKTYTVNKKDFKLTSKTRYYHRVGDPNLYEVYTKSKMTKLLSSLPSNLGGDIAFSVKNGKVTMLSAQ